MKLREYWKSLSGKERFEYAERVGVSEGYMRVHLIPARKTPRENILYGLSKESFGHVEHQDVLDHFFPDMKKSA